VWIRQERRGQKGGTMTMKPTALSWTCPCWPVGATNKLSGIRIKLRTGTNSSGGGPDHLQGENPKTIKGGRIEFRWCLNDGGYRTIKVGRIIWESGMD